MAKKCYGCMRVYDGKKERIYTNHKVSDRDRIAAQKGTSCCQECRKSRGTRRKRSAGQKPYPVGGSSRTYYSGPIRVH